MKIYPAIDLIAGQAVRLSQGRFDAKTVYQRSPIELARGYAAAGADFLHVVDLDGAKKGQPAHTGLLLELIAASGLQVQVGGGIRALEHVQALLEAGADRVIIGSLAVKQPQLTEQIFAAAGPEHITLAADARIDESGVPRVATHGWQADAALSVDDLITRYQPHGVRCILCTDISRDGEMRGPNVGLYRDLARRYPDIEILASGGVSTLDDLRALRDAGATGAVVGKALLQGAFTLEEALSC